MPSRDITLGAEVETYTITLDDYHIGRHFMLPRKSVIEKGESYHRDRSIGIEYASRPFTSIREALFNIKGGLKKSITAYRFEQAKKKRDYVLFFAGTWRDRFAATHFHVGLSPDDLSFRDAVMVSKHLHGHLPFLIALLANSPLYRGGITASDSNRALVAGDKFFYPLEFGELDSEYREEMTFNKSRKKRTPTLEIRPCDANLPEYMAAGLVVVKAVSMAAIGRKAICNRNSHERHLKAREKAARHGPAATLYWNNRPLRADSYLDKFFREYDWALSQMDIPPEAFEVFRLFKMGWNGAGILRRACRRHKRAHPRVWERYFAEEYADAVTALLQGETLHTFSRMLGLRPPDTSGIKLGNRKW